MQKGIVAVLIANLVNVAFSLATNFLLPKYLSIESYAGIKEFQLYVSYVGLFHLGFVDGIYLKLEIVLLLRISIIKKVEIRMLNV